MDWSLHMTVMSPILERFGKPQIYLFALVEKAKFRLFFLLRGKSPMGTDALAHEWSKVLYAFLRCH